MSTMSWINEGNEGCGIAVIFVVLLVFVGVPLGTYTYRKCDISDEQYTELKTRIDAHKESNPAGYEKVKVRVADAMRNGGISRWEFADINELIETNDRRVQFGVEIQ
jgi:hypothetical protein